MKRALAAHTQQGILILLSVFFVFQWKQALLLMLPVNISAKGISLAEFQLLKEKLTEKPQSNLKPRSYFEHENWHEFTVPELISNQLLDFFRNFKKCMHIKY